MLLNKYLYNTHWGRKRERLHKKNKPLEKALQFAALLNIDQMRTLYIVQY